MKLNHMNLTSVDVPADCRMFETYFEMTVAVLRGSALAVLRDDGGMLLVLNDFTKKRGSFVYPEDSDVHHIGFIQESKEQVDVLNDRLRTDGWDVPPPRDYHGSWTFYFKAKGGYFVEVATETVLPAPRRGASD